jgi:preprotein translocase subunit SecG
LIQLALVILHISICIALIVIVLLQTGKGSEIGAVFGGSSQTLFGSTGGSTFFGKLTTAVAIIFMLTSLFLAARSSRYTNESVMSDVKPAVTLPAAPESQSQAVAPVEEEKTPADAPVAEEQKEAPAVEEEGAK